MTTQRIVPHGVDGFSGASKADDNRQARHRIRIVCSLPINTEVLGHRQTSQPYPAVTNSHADLYACTCFIVISFHFHGTKQHWLDQWAWTRGGERKRSSDRAREATLRKEKKPLQNLCIYLPMTFYPDFFINLFFYVLVVTCLCRFMIGVNVWVGVLGNMTHSLLNNLDTWQ